MKVNFKWFLGRDLRYLTNYELIHAYETLKTHYKKSRRSQLAWKNIVAEYNRRGLKENDN